jgi:hypothetical protein
MTGRSPTPIDRDSRGSKAVAGDSSRGREPSVEVVRRPVHASAGGIDGAGLDGGPAFAAAAGINGSDGRCGFAAGAGFDELAGGANLDGAGGFGEPEDCVGFDAADGGGGACDDPAFAGDAACEGGVDSAFAGDAALGGGVDSAFAGDAACGGGGDSAFSRLARFLWARFSLRETDRGSRRGGNSSSVYILGHPVGGDSCELRQGHALNRTEIRAVGPPIDSPAAASPGEGRMSENGRNVGNPCLTGATGPVFL